MAKFSLSIIFDVVNKTTAPLKRIQKQFKSLGQTAEEVGKTMTRVGRTMTTAVTLPLAASFVLLTKKAISFESAFTGVRKTVTATEAQFKEMYDGFINLARVIPISTEDLMGIGEAAGQLGIETKNILGFTKVMADLGATTNLSGEDAAKILARFANITGMAQEDFDRLGSSIVALGNNFATTEAEITDMALRLAGAGTQVGLAQSEIVGLAAALSSVGLRSEAGGTAFSKVLFGMSKATATGGKKLNAFANAAGMSSGEFRKAFKEDAVGTLLAFTEGLKKMSDSGKNIILTLDKLGLDGIRVADSLLRASGANDLVRESMDLSTKAWEENNALVKEAELRYKTAGSQLKTFWNIFSQMAAAFGTVVLPPLIAITKVLGAIFIWMSTLDPAIKAIILVLGGLLAITGPIILAIGLIATAMAALSTVSLPVAAIVVGIAAAIAALAVVGILLWRVWKPVTEFFAEWFDNLKVGIQILGKLFGLTNKLPGVGVPIAGGNGGGAAGLNKQAVDVNSKNVTDVNLNLNGTGGALATVSGVRNREGNANVNVSNSGYVGILDPMS